MQILDIINKIKVKDTSFLIKDIEIENRIDWIDLDVRKVVNDIKYRLSNIDDYENVILLGMGGSSLAPLVFTTLYPARKRVFVLDTINPDEVKRVCDKIEGKRNIFIVSSKSGTTLETIVLYKYFRQNFQDGIFIFITDEGTPLDKQAKSEGKVVFNPNPNIGGRYSAFTEFGLVPTFLAGIDINKIADEVEEVKQNIYQFIDQKFEHIYKLNKISDQNDIYYILFRYTSQDFVFGLWLEQLIAESTGKSGKGILPVIYKGTLKFSIPENLLLGEFELKNFLNDLPKWMYLWFFYTVIASSYLRVNPFNQPDVQLSKEVTNKIISQNFKLDEHYEIMDDLESLDDRILNFVKKLDNLSYLAIQLYSSFDYFDFLEGLKNRIMDNLGVIVVTGFGPRYLHSIGQLYKGGPKNGIFIQIIIEPENELEDINRYFISQAIGDLITMKNLKKKIKGFYVKAKNKA